MSSELGRGSLCKATASRSLEIALGASENKVGVVESCLLRFFGGVRNWIKSMMLSLGDGRRILEIAVGIPAIDSSLKCIPCHNATVKLLLKYIYFCYVSPPKTT